jgi:hypothetical protein
MAIGWGENKDGGGVNRVRDSWTGLKFVGGLLDGRWIVARLG